MAGLKRRLERVEGLKIKSVMRGVAVGKNLFGGEIEEDLEGMSGKRVIGSVEEVTLIGKNNKKIITKAKIDTGAFSTSIDIELAKKLGFENIVDAFAQIDMTQYVLKRGKCAQIEKTLLNKYKKNFPELIDVAVIFSSSGVSIRPFVKVKFVLDKKPIAATTNITDRSDLKYDMIIGKRNLHNFLIDVSK